MPNTPVNEEFEGQKWLESASDEEIMALASYFDEVNSPLIGYSYTYIDLFTGRNQIGFKNYVCIDDAIPWLEKHKPDILAILLLINTDFKEALC